MHIAILWCCVGLATLSLAAAPARATEYDVFLLAGQSNMDGRGLVSDLVGPLSPWASAQSNVLISYSNSGTRGPRVTSNGWQILEPGKSSVPPHPEHGPTFGPEVGFAKVVADALPQRHIAIIKFCEGGTSLKKMWRPVDRGKLYDMMLDHVRSSLKALDARGDSYHLRGMLWHQGESDVGLPSEEYVSLLAELITHVRSDLNVADLPFLVGEVYEDGSRARIRAAEWAAADQIAHTSFISCVGPARLDHGTHFDAAAQIELGQRFGMEMIKHLQPPATTLPSLAYDDPNYDVWRARRLGMFIHWGPVASTGKEISWMRKGERRDMKEPAKIGIPAEEYDQLYRSFNPTKFDADQWVAIAKAAGMKYIVLVAKHHDGFCMFDSALTDYKVTNSPFKRDVTGELAKAAHAAGISFGVYYSAPDWHQPDFFTPTHEKYVEYMHGQVRELLTHYGQIDELWFDATGGTNKPETFGCPTLFQMIRELQPQILVTKRCGGGKYGDFDTPEQRVGGYNRGRPWETCMTLCTQWSWKPNDEIKTLKQVIETLIYSAGGDGNCLINVGPTAEGEIEAPQVARLKEMGEWLAHYGESIYGTRGGPYKPGIWGASTCAGNVVYLHLVRWNGDSTGFPPLGHRILKSQLLTGGEPHVTQDANGLTVAIAPKDRQEIDTIIKLVLDGPAMDLVPVSTRTMSLSTDKAATASSFKPGREPANAVDGRMDSFWTPDPEDTAPWLEIDLGQPTAIGEVLLTEGGTTGYNWVKQFDFSYLDGNDWKILFSGSKIGDRLEHRLSAPVTTRKVRLNVHSIDPGASIGDVYLFPPSQSD